MITGNNNKPSAKSQNQQAPHIPGCGVQDDTKPVRIQKQTPRVLPETGQNLAQLNMYARGEKYIEQGVNQVTDDPEFDPQARHYSPVPGAGVANAWDQQPKHQKTWPCPNEGNKTRSTGVTTMAAGAGAGAAIQQTPQVQGTTTLPINEHTEAGAQQQRDATAGQHRRVKTGTHDMHLKDNQTPVTNVHADAGHPAGNVYIGTYVPETAVERQRGNQPSQEKDKDSSSGPLQKIKGIFTTNTNGKPDKSKKEVNTPEKWGVEKAAGPVVSSHPQTHQTEKNIGGAEMYRKPKYGYDMVDQQISDPVMDLYENAHPLNRNTQPSTTTGAPATGVKKTAAPASKEVPPAKTSDLAMTKDKSGPEARGNVAYPSTHDPFVNVPTIEAVERSTGNVPKSRVQPNEADSNEKSDNNPTTFQKIKKVFTHNSSDEKSYSDSNQGLKSHANSGETSGPQPLHYQGLESGPQRSRTSEDQPSTHKASIAQSFKPDPMLSKKAERTVGDAEPVHDFSKKDVAREAEGPIAGNFEATRAAAAAFKRDYRAPDHNDMHKNSRPLNEKDNKDAAPVKEVVLPPPESSQPILTKQPHAKQQAVNDAKEEETENDGTSSLQKIKKIFTPGSSKKNSVDESATDTYDIPRGKYEVKPVEESINRKLETLPKPTEEGVKLGLMPQDFSLNKKGNSNVGEKDPVKHISKREVAADAHGKEFDSTAADAAALAFQRSSEDTNNNIDKSVTGMNKSRTFETSKQDEGPSNGEKHKIGFHNVTVNKLKEPNSSKKRASIPALPSDPSADISPRKIDDDYAPREGLDIGKPGASKNAAPTQPHALRNDVDALISGGSRGISEPDQSNVTRKESTRDSTNAVSHQNLQDSPLSRPMMMKTGEPAIADLEKRSGHEYEMNKPEITQPVVDVYQGAGNAVRGLDEGGDKPFSTEGTNENIQKNTNQDSTGANKEEEEPSTLQKIKNLFTGDTSEKRSDVNGAEMDNEKNSETAEDWNKELSERNYEMDGQEIDAPTVNVYHDDYSMGHEADIPGGLSNIKRNSVGSSEMASDWTNSPSGKDYTSLRAADPPRKDMSVPNTEKYDENLERNEFLDKDTTNTEKMLAYTLGIQKSDDATNPFRNTTNETTGETKEALQHKDRDNLKFPLQSKESQGENRLNEPKMGQNRDANVPVSGVGIGTDPGAVLQGKSMDITKGAERDWERDAGQQQDKMGQNRTTDVPVFESEGAAGASTVSKGRNMKDVQQGWQRDTSQQLSKDSQLTVDPLQGGYGNPMDVGSMEAPSGMLHQTYRDQKDDISKMNIDDQGILAKQQNPSVNNQRQGNTERSTEMDGNGKPEKKNVALPVMLPPHMTTQEGLHDNFMEEHTLQKEPYHRPEDHSQIREGVFAKKSTGPRKAEGLESNKSGTTADVQGQKGVYDLQSKELEDPKLDINKTGSVQAQRKKESEQGINEARKGKNVSCSNKASSSVGSEGKDDFGTLATLEALSNHPESHSQYLEDRDLYPSEANNDKQTVIVPLNAFTDGERTESSIPSPSKDGISDDGNNTADQPAKGEHVKELNETKRNPRNPGDDEMTTKAAVRGMAYNQVGDESRAPAAWTDLQHEHMMKNSVDYSPRDVAHESSQKEGQSNKKRMDDFEIKASDGTDRSQDADDGQDHGQHRGRYPSMIDPNVDTYGFPSRKSVLEEGSGQHYVATSSSHKKNSVGSSSSAGASSMGARSDASPILQRNDSKNEYEDALEGESDEDGPTILLPVTQMTPRDLRKAGIVPVKQEPEPRRSSIMGKLTEKIAHVIGPVKDEL
ncbi:Hbt1p KNAG_0L02380 [Huiozyma naganishii CBS 8797]|uniref:Uncharacterized protein n=1 Tax=Huiozyma naganishii (strain ATCC MYA-139 / BCRC 22969 / CBS 8797 / KCTC 17520 / NBRC 10181 / NCYC 3082 / Yp74L-3) TaxID=1071383 RepID=J7RSF7_HUIN7|nr:hypothetical protein KNAG_0L02380 [Kazachstania naganishii CBS 8797]CCK72853.1 hypothetical protein KNAG_0L02380 [Kazachstania naganishii CBS 8797]